MAGFVKKRYELPNLRSVNFVVDGAAPEVTSQTMATLGNELRRATVEVPAEMLEVSP